MQDLSPLILRQIFREKLIVRPNSIMPFLRLADGKGSLLIHLDKYLLRNGYNNYHWAFLGRRAVLIILTQIDIAHKP